MADKKIWEELDLIDSIKELNKYIGSMVYILLYSDSMVGSTKIADINKFMAVENILDEYIDEPEEVTVLHALVLNNQGIPYAIPNELAGKYTIACLQNSLAGAIEFEEHLSMSSVVDFIESEIDTPHTSIDDFAVVLFKKTPLALMSLVPPIEISASHKIKLGVTKDAK